MMPDDEIHGYQHVASSDLTVRIRISDRQWARVQPLIERYDPDAAATGRVLLDALLYQALSGRAWAEVAAEDPSWQAVQAVTERWQRMGLLDAVSHVLLVRLGGA